MKTLWLICYDISDHRKRSTVHKLLRNLGQPMQYSVFACELDSTRKQQLRTELAAIIEPDDSIRWYPQCVWCRERMIVLGTAKQTDSTDYFIV
ncbi:MAG: CRISPR-associated endonuclease Cas2 [Planctomycetaceae bacterium]|nr:CRISPR-associated endonuclease Cas2 [Planctomycetaceae bacterium]